MRIARWRIVLTASALLVLAAVGIGIVQAGPTTTTPAPAPVADDDPPFGGIFGEGPDIFGGPGFGGPQAGPPGGRGDGEPGPAGIRERLRDRLERLVNVQVTLDLPDDGIVTFRLDHGTVATIGSDSITVKEADGSSITLETDADTRLRKAGEQQELSALAVGDEVVVRSRKVDGTFVARGILVPPAEAAS